MVMMKHYNFGECRKDSEHPLAEAIVSYANDKGIDLLETAS